MIISRNFHTLKLGEIIVFYVVMCIKNKKITSEHSAELLGIEINNQLNFYNHVSTLCKNSGSSFNAVG